MAATYPELFAAGIVYSGVPAGCFYDQAGGADTWNNSCATGQSTGSADLWGSVSSLCKRNYSKKKQRKGKKIEINVLRSPSTWTPATTARALRCKSTTAPPTPRYPPTTTTRPSSSGPASLATTTPNPTRLPATPRSLSTPPTLGVTASLVCMLRVLAIVCLFAGVMI